MEPPTNDKDAVIRALTLREMRTMDEYQAARDAMRYHALRSLAPDFEEEEIDARLIEKFGGPPLR